MIGSVAASGNHLKVGNRIVAVGMFLTVDRKCEPGMRPTLPARGIQTDFIETDKRISNMLSTAHPAGNSPVTWVSLARDGKLDEALIAYIRQRGPASFTELVRDLSMFMETKGNLTIELRHNLVLWSGVSQAFFDLIKRVIASKQIVMQPTTFWVYMIDGASLSLPLARRVPPTGYVRPRWLPVVLCLADGKERKTAHRRRKAGVR